MEKTKLSWFECTRLAEFTAQRIVAWCNEKNVELVLYGVPRGGIHAMELIAGELNRRRWLFRIVDQPDLATVLVDDIIDSGATKEKYLAISGPNVLFEALVSRSSSDQWFVFPWEQQQGEIEGPAENVRRLIEYIGDNPKREGLLETPNRVLKSYDRLFGGYKENAADLIKVFEEGACNEMVILKNIQFYSTCEHHMLPFFGKAHVAYIPNGKVIGVSKLARLVDMYARRLQIQERIGTQVVDTIMELLNAKGAACMIKAQHFCMTARGVENQTGEMVTSALRGAFLDNASTRAEFLEAIKGA